MRRLFVLALMVLVLAPVAFADWFDTGDIRRDGNVGTDGTFLGNGNWTLKYGGVEGRYTDENGRNGTSIGLRSRGTTDHTVLARIDGLFGTFSGWFYGGTTTIDCVMRINYSDGSTISWGYNQPNSANFISYNTTGSWQTSGVALPASTAFRYLHAVISDGQTEVYADGTLLDTVSHVGVTVDMVGWASEANDAAWCRWDDFNFTETPAAAKIENSTWVVTSPVIPGGNSTAWDTGGRVNVSGQDLSFTVSTNVNTNMTCALDFEGNYTEMLAYDSRTKAATTETTSHAITLFENVSVGDHCVYCSFGDDGLGFESGNGTSHSGCLPLTRTEVYNSILAVDFNVSDFSFASTSYVTVFNETFNVSVASDFFLLSSMALQGSLGVSKTITGRLLLDGVVIVEEDLRTVSGTSTGVTGFHPLSFNAGVGEHALTFQILSSHPSAVYVSSQNWVLVNGLTADDNNSIGFNITTFEAGFSDNVFTSFYNWTESHIVAGMGYSIVSLKVSQSSESVSENVFYIGNDEDSPFIVRDLTSSSELGSCALSYVHEEEVFGDHTLRLVGVTDVVGNTVTVNASVFGADLRDNESHVIGAGSFTNPSTNWSNTLSLSGEGEIVSGDYYLRAGDGLGFSASVSVASTSGDQLATFVFNGSGCEFSINRTLTENVGNVFFYPACAPLVAGGNYSFSLRVVPEVGGSVVVYDEVLSPVEISAFDTSQGALPPIPNQILSPENGSNVFGYWNVTWLPFFDPNGDLDNYTVSLHNSTGDFNASIGVVDAGVEFIGLNFSLFDYDDFYIFVEGVDETGLVSNSSVFVSHVNESVNVTGLFPEQGEVLYGVGGVFLLNFSFNVSQGGNCSLWVDDVFNTSRLVVLGNNSFDGFSFDNGTSHNWSVRCLSDLGGGDSVYYFFSVDNFAPIGSFMDMFVCPSTLVESSLLWLCFGVGLVLIGFGLFGRAAFMGVFGSLVFMFAGFFFVACQGLFAFLFVGVGVVMLLYFGLFLLSRRRWGWF